MPISGTNTARPVSFVGGDAMSVPSVGLGDQFGAAFEEVNTIGSTFSALSHGISPFQRLDPNFKLWEALTTEEQGHPEDFASARNAVDLERIRRKRTHEATNNMLLAEGPLPAWLAALFTAIPDPVNLVPLLGGGTKLGIVGRSALGAASNVALTEGILQSTQEIRTAEESLASVLMGGLFGAGVGGGAALFKGVTPPLHREVTEDLLAVGREQHRARGEAVSSELPRIVQELSAADTKLESAAGYSRLRAWMGKYGLASLTQTTLGSPFDSVRAIFLKLSGSRGLSIKGHAKGLSEGVPTQVKIDSDINKAIYRLRVDADKYYKGHVEAARGAGERPLTRADFDAAVGRALTEGDESLVFGATAAAKGYRRTILDPWLKKMQQAGELPDDLPLVGMETYLSRVYDRTNMRAYRQKFVEVVARWFRGAVAATTDDAGKSVVVTPKEIEDVANDIFNRIMGQSESRAGAGRLLDERSPLKKGVLKERTFHIPDAVLRNVDIGNGMKISFLNNHAEEVLERYVRSVASDYHLKQDWGTVRPEDDIMKQINAEVAEKVKGLAPKEAAKLQRQATSEMEGIVEAIGRMRGTTGFPKDMRESMIARSLQFMRNVNFTRSLGSVMVSSIPDAAIQVMKYGLARTMGPLFKDMLSGFKGVKLSAKDARALGQATDLATSVRAKSIMGTEHRFAEETSAEAFMNRAAHGFATATGLNHWNTFMKSTGTALYTTRALSLIKKKAEGGTLTAKENSILARYGISPDMARRIAKYQDRWIKEGDLILPNLQAWPDWRAAQVFRYSTYAAVDDLVLMPGVADAPLWTSSPIGKTLTQFKRFAISADQRIFHAGLQQANASTLVGMAMMVGAGMLVTFTKDIVNSGAVKERSIGGWTAEGIDRSGIMTAFVEADTAFTKFFGTGALKLLAGEELNRVAPRGLVTQAAGPTAGAIYETIGAIQGAARGEFTEKDLNKISRLVPFQNYILTSYLYKQLIGNLAKQMELPEQE